MFQPPPPDPGKLLLAGTLDRVRMTASASGPHSLDEPRTLVSTSCEMNLQHEGGGRRSYLQLGCPFPPPQSGEGTEAHPTPEFTDQDLESAVPK